MTRTEHPMRADELQYAQRALVIAACSGDIDVSNAATGLFGALRKRLNDGRMGNVFGGAASYIGQSVELFAPGFRHR